MLIYLHEGIKSVLYPVKVKLVDGTNVGTLSLLNVPYVSFLYKHKLQSFSEIIVPVYVTQCTDSKGSMQ